MGVAPIEPMYATSGAAMPEGDGWTFEPKYDGIRVIAFATAGEARLVTRNGNDKSRQFPEIVEALRALAVREKLSLVLDGEIVALVDGEPARFQSLQSRMHVQDAGAVAHHVEHSPVAFVAFDLLLEGDDVLMRQPWSVRRQRLEQRVKKRLTGRLASRIRLTDSSSDGEALIAKARAAGWEGVIAKRTDATYRPGTRVREWLKLKVENRQELVVGGYTEPRNSRKHFGALLLGYFDDHGQLVYAGHTGGGFTEDALDDMARRLAPLARDDSPFSTDVRTNEVAHWVHPRIVVEVKFNEWTDVGKLRQPIFIGVRDDKPARDVHRESTRVTRATRSRRARV